MNNEDFGFVFERYICSSCTYWRCCLWFKYM